MKAMIAVMLRWFIAIALAGLLCTGCNGGMPPTDGGDASVPLRTWNCPSGWVESAVGGCGPATVLCAPDGGAAPDACAAIDPYAPQVRNDPDGGATTPLYRAHGGGFAGGWHEPDDAAPYPPTNWTPDAGNGSAGDAWAPTVGFDSCPAGWTATADGACDPHVATSCEPSSGPLPGGQCTATGASSCATGPYADPGPAAIGATVVHARAMADASSADGSEAHPFASIQRAIDAAGPGGYVLVAAGRYAESITIAVDVHVLGSCSHDVSIGAQANASALTIASAAHAELRGLTIEGPGRGIEVTMGAALTLDRIVFASVADAAMVVRDAGSSIRATDVWAHDLAAGMTTAGVALELHDGVTADISRLSIQHARQNAITVAETGGTLALDDVAILSTDAGDAMHQATISLTGGSIDLTRAVIDDNIAFGLSFFAASATLRDVVIERTVAARESGSAIYGERGRLESERLHIDGVTGGNGLYTVAVDASVRASLVENLTSFPNHPASGIGVALVGGEVHVTNLHVRHGQEYGALFYSRVGLPEQFLGDAIVENIALPDPNAAGGGIVGFDVHAMHLDRVLVHDVPLFGIGIDHGCDGDVHNAVIYNVRDPAERSTPSGLLAYQGGHMTASDVAIHNVGGIGAIAQTPDTTLDLTHSFIGHIDPAMIGSVAVSGGVLVAEGAHASVRTTRIEDIPVFGFATYQADETGTSAELIDSAIVHIWAPMLEARPFAAAFAALSGTTATLRRSLVSDASPIGAIATEGATLNVRESAFRDTRTATGGTASAALLGTGTGVLDASDTLIERPQNTGIIAVAGGHVAFRDGIVTSTQTDLYGFGTGVNASGDAHVALERVALLDTRGAALMATPYQDPLTPRTVGAGITATDLYVARVASSTIRIDYDDSGNPQPNTQLVSYGAHVGAMCTVDLSRATLRDAGYGFYTSSGVFTLRDGVIASMIESGGAQSGGAPSLIGVGFIGNASDAIVQRNDLPEGSMLPAPQPACSTPGCL